MEVEEILGVQSGTELQKRRTTAVISSHTNGDGALAPVPANKSVPLITVHSMMAGYVAGICGVLVGHPLDSIKVWIQMQVKNGATHGTNNTATTAFSVEAVQRSLKHLYAGVQGPLLTVGLIQALNFGVYDASRRYLYSQRKHGTAHVPSDTDDYLKNGSIIDVAIASSIAGAVISVPTSVLQATKIYQQVHHVWSLRDAATALYRQNGVRAFFAGMGPHFACESLGRMVYFTSYAWLKQCIVNDKISNDQIDENEELSLHERIFCAGTSGMLCWALIFPVDVLRCRMYAAPPSGIQTAWQMAQTIYQQEQSWRPFYRGLGVTVLRAAPVSAAVLPVYDMAHAWMSTRLGG